ncbi:MAG: hypothetical protein WBJ84_01220 [Bacteroidales bacterium]
MKLRITAILTVLILVPFYISAQDYNRTEKPKRWYLGGNFGLQFGTITLIDISPIVGYKLTEKLALGVGGTYKFYSIRSIYNPKERYKTNIWGGSCFARYSIFPQLFAHTEYEYLLFRRENLENIDFHSIFIGGGYRQYFSEHNALEIMLLYNLNETDNSPYSNPVIRVGLVFGI